MSARCEGYTLSGAQCKRLACRGSKYCVVHSRASEIGLPPYIPIASGETLWVYLPIGTPTWKVGGPSNTLLRSPSKKDANEYTLVRWISEGTYGAVYEAKDSSGGSVALKISKEIYRKRSSSNMTKAAEFDFLREYSVYSAIGSRVGRGIAVDIMEAIFVRTRSGLHGGIAMSLMDGPVDDLFDFYAGSRDPDAMRLWVKLCAFLSTSLVRMHEKQIYHMDVKAGNVMQSGGGKHTRLIDMGLSCYLEGSPPIKCRATGTYIPPEWRDARDPRRPTFEEMTNPIKLERGDIYAACVAMCKMLKRINPTHYMKNEKAKRLITLARNGKDDASPHARNNTSLRDIAVIAASLATDLGPVANYSFRARGDKR